MRLFFRIIYALFMVTLFWFTLNTASNIVTERYINKYVVADLESENPNYLYFYSTIPTYNHRTPLYSLDTETMSIRFYEIAVRNGQRLDEYVYVLFHKKDGFDNTLDHYLSIEGLEQPVEYAQGQIYEVLVMVNLEQVYIPKSLMEANLGKEWSIKTVSTEKQETDEEVEDPIVFSFTPTLQRAFEVKTAIEAYHNLNEAYPKTELEANNIYYYEQPDYSEYYIIYFSALSIYGVVLAISLTGLMIYDLKKKRA